MRGSGIPTRAQRDNCVRLEMRIWAPSERGGISRGDFLESESGEGNPIERAHAAT